MNGCTKLRNFPAMSTHTTNLYMGEMGVEDLPASVRLCSDLWFIDLGHNGNLKGMKHLPASLSKLRLSYSDIETIPDCIKDLHELQDLFITGCRRLKSLPELPPSLRRLFATDCESLETIFCPFNYPKTLLNFTNCFKLDQQARRAIFRQRCMFESACIPGREVPEEFGIRKRGCSLTIPPTAFPQFKVCLVISLSPNNQTSDGEYTFSYLLCRRTVINGNPHDQEVELCGASNFRTEHLLLFHAYVASGVNKETALDFSCISLDFDVIECGVQIWTEEFVQGSCDQVFEDDNEFEPSNAFEDDDRTKFDCWSWLFSCFDLEILGWGRRRP